MPCSQAEFVGKPQSLTPVFSDPCFLRDLSRQQKTPPKRGLFDAGANSLSAFAGHLAFDELIYDPGLFGIALFLSINHIPHDELHL